MTFISDTSFLYHCFQLQEKLEITFAALEILFSHSHFPIQPYFSEGHLLKYPVPVAAFIPSYALQDKNYEDAAWPENGI